MAKVKGAVIKITSSGTVSTANKAAILRGYTLIGGTTASKVIFNNGGSGGADTYAGTTAAGTNVGDVTKSENLVGGDGLGIIFNTDIYCTLSGTGAYAYVYYEEIG